MKEDMHILLLVSEQKMINIIRLAARPKNSFTVNDYREFHTKVWVANAAQTITRHMNYGWGSSFQLLCVIHIKESISLDKLS